MNFTHNNHLKFGWGDGLYNFDNKDDQFWTEFTPAEYMPTSFKTECLRSARLIGEAANGKPVLVALSGGIDSEITVRCFLEVGVPVEVLTANIIHNGKVANAHETVYGDNFIKKFGIKSHVVNMDFHETIVARANSIRATNNPATPYYRVRLPFLSQAMFFEPYCQDYYCVRGGGDVALTPYRYYRQPEPVQYGLYVPYAGSFMAMYELASRQNAGCCQFFSYTSEILLAWMLDPVIQHWMKYERTLMAEHCWMNTHAVKPYIMYSLWPDMEIRPKLTGFERIPEFLELYMDPFYNDSKELVKIPAEDTFKALVPK